MSEEARPIVIKRIKKSAPHHGGAWKIAYADFVTAMMAFFLLMWLLGSTTRGDLEGIANYFKTPLKVAMAGGSGSGDSSHVIQGGGKDLTRKDGQFKNAEIVGEKKNYNIKSANELLEKVEGERLRMLKRKIEEIIESNPILHQYRKQLLLDITPDGLRIQIVDEHNRPMFALASAELQPYTREILHEIGLALNEVPNRVSLSGHTDATPYSTGEKSYSNWELSADRANASRRELIAGGMDERKILRVVGLSSVLPFDKDDPYKASNRRISIIVMNKKAELAALQELSGLEVSGEEKQVPGQAGVAPAAQAE